MPLVLSIKDQSKLPKGLSVGGQGLDRVMSSIQIVDKNPQRKVTLLLYSNKIDSLNTLNKFSIQLN